MGSASTFSAQGLMQILSSHSSRLNWCFPCLAYSVKPLPLPTTPTFPEDPSGTWTQQGRGLVGQQHSRGGSYTNWGMAYVNKHHTETAGHNSSSGVKECSILVPESEMAVP